MLPMEQRWDAIVEATETSDPERHPYCWQLWARPAQLPPDGDWRVWLYLGGRGAGKTRAGAEYIRAQVAARAARRIAIISPTAADARDVIVEGDSGLLAICPDGERPDYEPSKRRLTWPNGAVATLYSADEPKRLRGPQHDLLWADEMAHWRYPETWDMALMGLRIGGDPRAIVTTTPKPVKILKELMADPNTVTVRSSTYENLPNLAPMFREQIVARYEGTRLGRQELYAEILDDNPDALWQRKDIEATRVLKAPDLVRVVVAVDPQARNEPASAETGIVAAGKGADGRAYVLDDLSIKATPETWAQRAVTGYYRHRADRLVGEVNNGGDMVEFTIRTVDPKVAYKAVHASRGKQIRAEPVSALYEQGKVSHVGMFSELEDQLCEWVPGDKSPDRLDALVWALTELMLDDGGGIEFLK